MRKIISAVILVLSFWGYAGAQAGDVKAVWNSNVACGGTITENTILAADLDCSGVIGTALTIGADNIVLDGNGYKIIAPNASVVVSIIGRSNVTTRNIDLSGPAGHQRGYGLYLITVINSLIENVTAHNREYGIFSDWPVFRQRRGRVDAE
ncbi:MAG: hypothetical protein HY746_02305 [Elusimicrobia bacterium]|nr:hypothetical protein [Elusimicrobiota bacterium]